MSARPTWFLAAALFLCGCTGDRPDAAYQPEFGAAPTTPRTVQEYRFAIYPLHNPAQLFALYGPLVDRLNAELPEARFSLTATRSYEDFDRRLGAREFDLALANPYQIVGALGNGYQIFARLADDDLCHGILVARRDGPIRELADLRGRTISFPAPTAVAAGLLPRQFLRQHGLADDAYQARYVGSQESSIMSVYLGDSAAGATWPRPWQAFQNDHPERAAQLKVMWRTPPLACNGVLARDDFPPRLRARVAAILFGLGQDTQGRALLERSHLTHFRPADATDYQTARAFVAECTGASPALPAHP